MMNKMPKESDNMTELIIDLLNSDSIGKLLIVDKVYVTLPCK